MKINGSQPSYVQAQSDEKRLAVTNDREDSSTTLHDPSGPRVGGSAATPVDDQAQVDVGNPYDSGETRKTPTGSDSGSQWQKDYAEGYDRAAPEGRLPWERQPTGDNVTKISLSELSLEARLENLLDPWNEVAPGSDGGYGTIDAPGDRSGADLLNQPTVSNGYGKVTVSERAQHSGGDDPVYDSANNYLGTRAELEALGAEQWGGGLSNAEVKKLENEQRKAGFSDAELYRMGREQEAERRGGVNGIGEAVVMVIKQTLEVAQQNLNRAIKQIMEPSSKRGAGSSSTPNPLDDTGDPHVNIPYLGGDPDKAPKLDGQAERKRQITLPDENRQRPDRMYVDAKELYGSLVGRRTNGNSTPTGSEPGAIPPGEGISAGRWLTPGMGFGPSDPMDGVLPIGSGAESTENNDSGVKSADDSEDTSAA